MNLFCVSLVTPKPLAITDQDSCATEQRRNIIIIIIIIILLFKEDYLLSKHTYLTYGPL